jgi:hypothetical protein
VARKMASAFVVPEMLVNMKNTARDCIHMLLIVTLIIKCDNITDIASVRTTVTILSLKHHGTLGDDDRQYYQQMKPKIEKSIQSC